MSQSTQKMGISETFPKPTSWLAMEKQEHNTTKARIQQSKQMHYNTK